VRRWGQGAEDLAASAVIGFNYLGQWDETMGADGVWRPVAGPRGAERAAGLERPHLVEVSGYVLDGQLHVDWEYSPRHVAPASIARWAAAFAAALTELVDHCRAQTTAALSPADFPLARLDAERLAALSELIAEIDATASN